MVTRRVHCDGMHIRADKYYTVSLSGKVTPISKPISISMRKHVQDSVILQVEIAPLRYKTMMLEGVFFDDEDVAEGYKEFKREETGLVDFPKNCILIK